MSKLKNEIHDWLEDFGYDLGYTWNDLPDLSDMDRITENNVQIWEYKGVTEKEYYNEQKTITRTDS